MKYALYIAIGILILSSCGQRAWTKRGKKRGWIKSEIKYDTVYTDSVFKDTVFLFGRIRDTVILKEDKLTVKYFYNRKDSTVYLSGECDKDTLIVEKEIIRVETKEGFYWKTHMIGFLLVALIILLVFFRFSK
jgi:hypothetical protein